MQGKADALIAKLDGVMGKGPSWRAICPAHPSKSRTRTLSVLERQDGGVLLHCFAGCSVDAIVGAVGLELTDLFPERRPDNERLARTKKPWSVREVAQALEIPLTSAFLLLAKIGGGAQLSRAERKEAARVSLACVAMLDELME